jgi:hypothetical protein
VKIWLPLASLAALAQAPVMAKQVCPGPGPDPAFDAPAAWDEAYSELATNYAYWDRIDAPALFGAAAPALKSAPDRLQFADRLQTLLLLFRDSHIHVSPTPEPNAAWVPSAADIWLEERGGRLIVRDVKGNSQAAKMGVRPGWILLTMDGADPRRVAAARFAAIGIKADDAQLLYAVNSLISGTLGKPRSFEFRVNGRLRSLQLPPGYDSVQRPDAPLTVSARYDHAGHLVAVLRINNSLGKNELIAAFDKAVADLLPTTHVIIDMRDTPSGGNSTVARAMLSHFVEQPKPYQRHELTSERQQFGVSRSWIEFVEPRPPYLTGKVIVLSGLWTGSMGEGITIGYDSATNATVIGSQMGQLLGAMIEDELPKSCLKVSFANEKLWHVNGTPREDYLPEVQMPAADTAVDGSDPALGAAISLVDKWDSKSNP